MEEIGFVLVIIGIGIILLNPGLLILLVIVGIVTLIVLYFSKLEEQNVDEMNINSYECREALKKVVEIQNLFERAVKNHGGHSHVSLYDKRYEDLTNVDYENAKYQLCIYIHLNVENYGVVKFYKNQYKYNSPESLIVAKQYAESLFSISCEEIEKIIPPEDILFDTELIEPDESYYVYRFLVPSVMQGNKREVFIKELKRYQK